MAGFKQKKKSKCPNEFEFDDSGESFEKAWKRIEKEFGKTKRHKYSSPLGKNRWRGK